MLFSGFTQTAYCTCPLHIHTYNPAIVCLCLARRPACQGAGPLPGLMLTDSHLTPVSWIFWMTLAVFQTFTAVSRNEKWSDREGGECGIVNTFPRVSRKTHEELEASKMNHRLTDRERIISNHIRDYFMCLAWFL